MGSIVKHIGGSSNDIVEGYISEISSDTFGGSSNDIFEEQIEGSSNDIVEDFTSQPKEPRTIVMVGRAGNGKSATGNSILGRKAFVSKPSLSGVTRETTMQSAMLKDGQRIRVIDTMGLFDSDVDFEEVCDQIVKCVELAKDGIHGVLLVLSVRCRFTEEEARTLKILLSLFGPNFTDYMIVLFTGGDDLPESDDNPLDDHLKDECPEALQEILDNCKNRRILFNNKLTDIKALGEQRRSLLNMIEQVVKENHGYPYTDAMFRDFQEQESKRRKKEEEKSEGLNMQEKLDLKEALHREREEHMKQTAKMVEKQLLEVIKSYQEKLEMETAARTRAEEKAAYRKEKNKEEKKKYKGKMNKQPAAPKGNNCSIL